MDVSKLLEVVLGSSGGTCRPLVALSLAVVIWLIRDRGKEREACERRNRENLALVEKLLAKSSSVRR